MPVNLLFDKACQLYLQRFTWSPVWYLIKPAIIFANIHVTPNIPGISTGRPRLIWTGSYQEVSSFFAPNINVSVTSCWIQLRLAYQEACSWWQANFWLNLGLKSSENINLLVEYNRCDRVQEPRVWCLRRQIFALGKILVELVNLQFPPSITGFKKYANFQPQFWSR